MDWPLLSNRNDTIQRICTIIVKSFVAGGDTSEGDMFRTLLTFYEIMCSLLGGLCFTITVSSNRRLHKNMKLLRLQKLCVRQIQMWTRFSVQKIVYDGITD